MPQTLVEKNRNLIKNYLKSLNVPQWFRGMSVFQTKAAESLQTAMRDDLGQKTTHRTFGCLMTLGLQPLPTASQIWKLLLSSRGNAIAFLWFLKEWLYEQDTPSQKSPIIYSLNEQLIYSAIAQLDLPQTLRELDRILPRNPRMEMKTASNSLKEIRKKPQDGHGNRKGKFAPYFESLKTLRQRKSQYTISPPKAKAHLESFEKKTNAQDHNPPWFQDYPVKEKCDEEISELKENFDKFMIDNSKVQQLSENHQSLENIKESFENEMGIIFNTATEAWREDEEKFIRHRRTMQRLRRDIEKYRREFQTKLERHRKHYILEILTNGLNKSQSLYNFLSPCKRESSGNFATLIPCRRHEASHGQRSSQSCGCLIGQLVRHDSKVLACHNKYLPKMDMLMSCQDNKDIPGDKGEEVDNHKPNENCGCLVGQGDGCRQHCSCCRRTESSASLRGFKEKYMSLESLKSLHSQNSGTSLPAPQYFWAPNSNHNSPHFDYRKIFEFKTTNPAIMEFQSSFLEAIDSDIALLNRLQKQQYFEANLPEKALQEAIDKCYWKSFHQGLEEQENLEKLNNSQESKIYDPHDEGLMDRMLKDALDRMKKDPRFVLASLPEAHCLPYLREWIRLRYGKRYARMYLTKLCDQDQGIFRALIDTEMTVPVPPTSDLGISSLVDYSCRDYLRKKSDFIRKHFYTNINKAMLEQSRLVYFAMRPLLCGNAWPNNTIFAYMPAHGRQICNFRPWRSHEFNDNRQMAMERLRQVKAKRGSLYL
ncbi:uncharacterized protein LOC101897259 [Musca domestica]|uniref:Uncharacterized protein LOC101897259 n=1 Tax=Musca domestica TaxID=7370 RepID=A0ABM3V8I7_MUSDO|nr:uncharacterized protein LOC101897259 [Musca domestica]